MIPAEELPGEIILFPINMQKILRSAQDDTEALVIPGGVEGSFSYLI